MGKSLNPQDSSPASPMLSARLSNGREVQFRPLTENDAPRLDRAHEVLSPQTLERRFLHPVHQLDRNLTHYLTHIDQHDHIAWGVLPANQPDHLGYGVGRFIRLPSKDTAEFAFTVIDEQQGNGLGTIMLALLWEDALRHGVVRFTAEISHENYFLVKRLREIGAESERDGNTFHLSFSLEQRLVEVGTTFAQRLASYRQHFRRQLPALEKE